MKNWKASRFRALRAEKRWNMPEFHRRLERALRGHSPPCLSTLYQNWDKDRSPGPVWDREILSRAACRVLGCKPSDLWEDMG